MQAVKNIMSLFSKVATCNDISYADVGLLPNGIVIVINQETPYPAPITNSNISRKIVG